MFLSHRKTFAALLSKIYCFVLKHVNVLLVIEFNNCKADYPKLNLAVLIPSLLVILYKFAQVFNAPLFKYSRI